MVLRFTSESELFSRVGRLGDLGRPAGDTGSFLGAGGSDRTLSGGKVEV